MLSELKKTNIQHLSVPAINQTKLNAALKDAFPLEKEAVTELSFANLHRDYPIINLDFLKMQNEDGWPRFAVFSITQPECRLEFKARNTETIRTMKAVYTPCYRNLSFLPKNPHSRVYTHFYKWFEGFFDRLEVSVKADLKPYMRFWKPAMESTAFISQSFAGLLPTEVRGKIRQAVANWKFDLNYIFLICEAQKWVEGKEIHEVPKPADPLVVGWHPEAKHFFLLADFDIVPIEEYVKREFCEG